MGQSITAATHPPGSFSHSESRSRVATISRNGQQYHRVDRNSFTAEYPIAFTIGSGKVGHSYAVAIAGSVFESPISWFSQSGRWDMSPGYGRNTAPDFDRRITMECLYCHTGGMRRVTDQPHTITCDRCHQPSGKHFANPAKLTPAERDRTCEQCHLQGEARILNPGSTWNDPNPSFTTYVSSRSPGVLKVVSQVEQLALSKCSQKSEGRLWCGTCHNPHGEKKNQREVCLGCHAGALPATHPSQTQDCSPCHMPRRPTPEVAHTVYTDHRIRKKPGEPAPSTAARVISAWREPQPEFRERNLGLAYLTAGQRDRSVDLIQEGFRILLALKNKDAEVCDALGSVFMQKQRPKEAARMYAGAKRLQPDNPRNAHNLGIALLSQGEVQAAIAQLEAAIKLDPLFEQSYLALAQIYQQNNHPELRRQTLDRYLKLVPQSLSFRQAVTAP